MTIDERSLDEAILEFKERAEDSKKMSELGLKSYIPKEKKEKQIAEWLEELKEYKKNSNTCPMCDEYCSYLADEFENGYNKALDDFVMFANTMPTVEEEYGTIRPMWLEEIAEQLKEGGENE